MRDAGKVSVVVILVAAFVIGLGAMALVSGESATGAAARFMSALEVGDYKTLASLSYADGVSLEELEEQWKYTTEVAAPHFRFTYEIKDEKSLTPTTSVVWMMYHKNAGTTEAFEERFELPMVKTDDGWKVDIYSVNRGMYPGLPR